MSIDANYQIAIQKYGKDYVEEAKQYFWEHDIDKNGQVTADDIYNGYSQTYSNTFKGNSIFEQIGEEIAVAQREMYAKYAGEDSILDVYEYMDALNSEENEMLLEEFRKMADESLQDYMDIEIDDNEETKNSTKNNEEVSDENYDRLKNYMGSTGELNKKLVDKIVQLNGYPEYQNPILEEQTKLTEKRFSIQKNGDEKSFSSYSSSVAADFQRLISKADRALKEIEEIEEKEKTDNNNNIQLQNKNAGLEETYPAQNI